MLNVKIMNTPAPKPCNRLKVSKYRELFENMGVGSWVRVPKEHAARYQNAIGKYAKRGTFSMYLEKNRQGYIVTKIA